MQKKTTSLDKALRVLGMRAHSEKEIIDKLTKAQFDAHDIAATMSFLAEYGLIDDAIFAKAWAESRAKKGLGPYRIDQELQQKGIPSELRDAVLSEIDENESLHSAIAIAKKYIERGDENAKRRAFDAICRRGHTYATARQAIAQAIEEPLEGFETICDNA